MSDENTSSSPELDSSIDVFAIQLILSGFTDQMTKLEDAAAEQKSTIQP